MASLAKLRLGPQSGRRDLISPIGLEFADEGVNLVQLQWAHPPLIKAHASLPYPVERTELLKSAPAFKGFLKQAISLGPFTGRKVVTALPTDDVRSLSVTYQVKPGETDGQAIGKLMEERVGEDLGQFVIDYVPVRSEVREGDRLAMVLISERSTVVSHLEQLRKVGLEVTALEVSSVAIKRWVSTLIGAGEAPQNVLVINVGKHKTYLTMVSGQRLLFDQEIDFGERAVLDHVSLALDSPRDVTYEIVLRNGVHPGLYDRSVPGGIDDTRSFNMLVTIVRPQFANLVAEIRRAVLFASSETRGGSVGHAFLMGGFARWPGADALLSSLTDMPVAIPLPLPIASDLGEDAEAQPHPELVVSAGLALRGLAADA